MAALKVFAECQHCLPFYRNKTGGALPRRPTPSGGIRGLEGTPVGKALGIDFIHFPKRLETVGETPLESLFSVLSANLCLILEGGPKLSTLIFLLSMSRFMA